jgi:hypothetical protein
MDRKMWCSGHGFKEDERDYQWEPVACSRAVRYWTPGRWVGDQQQTPSCVGFAWSHWLSCAPVVSWLDPLGIYDLAKFLDEWQGEAYGGTSVRAGAKVLKRLGLMTQYAFAADVSSLVAAVLEVGPIVVGTEWLEDMFEPNANGQIFATGASAGGHAYLIDGVDTLQRHFRIKSSYGDRWGTMGHARIDFDDFDRLVQRGAEMCVAVERKPSPA